MKKKIKSNFFIFTFNSVIILIVFLIIELILRLKYNQTNSFNCYNQNEVLRNYTNGNNCYFIERYFEKKNETLYITDNNGMRINKTSDKTSAKAIYFIGDSFTFGHLSNYQETYPYNSVNYINKTKNKELFIEKNLGVNGYQFRQNISLIKDISNNKKDSLIVYGLTPNDLFDLQEKEKVVTDYNNYSFLDWVKIKIDTSNLISIKFFSYLLLKNDNLYLAINQNRGDKAGFVNKSSSNFWEKKYRIFKREINGLQKETRDRLIITIIPQQIQIRLLKKGLRLDALSFDKNILQICKQIKITCFSLTEELATNTNYKTHYTLDGHLLPEANREYGKILGKHLLKNMHKIQW